MIRALVERLPVMIAPRWVAIPSQPIAIQDLLAYLIEALDFSSEESRIFEIGGADQVSYGGLMSEYSRQRGLKRLILPVPFLTPRLSSLWLGLVTPLYVRVGRKLIDSIRHPTVVRDRSARNEFSVRPVGYREAIAAALRADDQMDADSSAASRSRFVHSLAITVNATAEQAFTPIRRIGGSTGWYYANWLWSLRGILDVWMGGLGLNRGRRHPDELEAGDIVDCWQVEDYEANHRLRLAARMKMPGRAWLEFRVDTRDSNSEIRQIAIFDPLGVAGRAYWYVTWPVHRILFPAMLKQIGRAAGGGAGVVV
jgi:hypothetical protein